VLRSTVVRGQLRLEQSDQPASGGFIQEQLVSPPVRARLHGNAQCPADGVFQTCCGCHVVWVWGGSRLPGLSAAHDLGFEVPDRPVAVDRTMSELTSTVVVRFGEERLAVALGELSAVDSLDRQVRQFEEPDRVGQVAATPAQPACEVGPRNVEVVE
jgi:hypothetical protein